MQRTLKSAVSFSGVGLHSGKPVTMKVCPAPVGRGIWFRRTDLPLRSSLIPARWDAVHQSPLCTKIENASGESLSTIEHIMAALAGCGVSNALVEVSGPEVPILDGSAAAFVRGIMAHGLKEQNAPLKALKILKPVEFRAGEAWARLDPADALSIEFHIDFADAAIGVQHKALNMSNGSFVRELCDSRTFCRKSDVDAMHDQGLALGGTYENAVVVDGAKVLSPGGLRHSDEAVRHKMLDALGDLMLAGAPILGRYTGHRAGHAITNSLLRAVFADAEAYEWVTCDDQTAAKLPGAGLHWDEIPAAFVA
ncbi:UDP-3-O-acyl-N-acetylglucosamine deacetylase [Litorivita sp. NS0012-18]|uniref:UDP-3-O-acyl-N-acetylglucosamine deacetylase n=1 Tax=Litorivita sp. NS0012-18 TaxID=3127655 RepID=UPI0031068B52